MGRGAYDTTEARSSVAQGAINAHHAAQAQAEVMALNTSRIYYQVLT